MPRVMASKRLVSQLTGFTVHGNHETVGDMLSVTTREPALRVILRMHQHYHIVKASEWIDPRMEILHVCYML